MPSEKKVNIIGPYNPPKNLDGFNIVADSSLKYYEGDFDMVVTDLDGPIDKILLASNQKKWVVVHGHGDNMDKLESFVPKLKGNLLGTTQSIPVGKIRNIGGFTDGDRAVIMGICLGAKEIRIYGFNFEKPVDEPKELKIKKMSLGREIIEKFTNIRIEYMLE